MNEQRVAVIEQNTPAYPKAPFSPAKIFPELNSPALTFLKNETLDESNEVYTSVRELFIKLEMDKEHIGTPDWEPFREMIKPGQHAVLKANFVKGNHPLNEVGITSMITHASVMRAVIDYLLLSTNGNCKITICDVALQSSVWEEIIEGSGTKALVEFYAQHGIQINLLDLRREISHLNDQFVIDSRDFADRDPLGYAAVDLGKQSALMPIIHKYKRFMITDYGRGTVPEHHNPEKNEYCIAKTILSADLFINLPKLKSHRKTGLTCALKNLIGMNGDKRWIAHHTERSKGLGGDEFPKYVLRNWFEFRLFSFLKRNGKMGIWAASQIRKNHTRAYKIKNQLFGLFGIDRTKKGTSTQTNTAACETYVPPERIYHISYDAFLKTFPGSSREVFQELNPVASRPMEGSWYGNDTLWRTVSDLNHIIFFADKNGELRETVQRNYFCIVDGIIGGEKEAPMEHTPKFTATLVGGTHPLAIDFGCARIMDFDYNKIPMIKNLFEQKVNFSHLTPDQIELVSNRSELPHFHFRPARNWKGHIETDPRWWAD
ncbi:MAG: DUF362 domain-containing protein [Candidatus Kerfeldbacteria bacterium]|nr:DUF362 domain-containing protein [Candidatus Kerfeldbacteria bacterium]